MTAGEQTMLRSLDTRVTHWSEVSPFYSDAKAGPGKSAESRATEAVLNAVILASYDTALGQLRSVTRTAFEEAWALQLKLGEDAGGWQWQDFHLAPWESASSAYQGAAMLAIAVEEAPDHYADEAQIATNLELLEAYLKRQYPSEPLIGQLYVLWASARMPRLLDASQRAQLEGRIDALEQADGGWSLYSLDAKESWNHLQELSASDGCATALVVLALEQSGVSRQDAALRRGVAWLQHHQYEDGSWRAASLNKNRNPETQVGRFMSDAATGYASLALEMYQSTSARRPAPAEKLQAGWTGK